MGQATDDYLVKSILNEIRGLPPDERKRVLDRRCGANGKLREFFEWPEEDAEAVLASIDAAIDGAQVLLPPSDEAIAATLVGKTVSGYQLVRPLARGGLAYVFLGVSPVEDPPVVAVKVAQIEKYVDAPGRFAQEAALLGLLDHRNITRFIGRGEAGDGRPCLITEYVRGEPLLAYCDRRRLTVRERLVLFEQVLDAIAYAHGSNVVHRDVNPSNVLVTDDGVPKLLDFGIARWLEDVRDPGIFTKTAMTLPYASPEQVMAGDVTPATDVFSAGATLYELLTGHRPFADADPRRLEETIRLVDPPPPSERVRAPARILAPDGSTAEVPPEELAARRGTTVDELAAELRGALDAVVLAAMQKAPRRRYRSARAFAADVRNVLEKRPVAARVRSARAGAMRVAAAVAIALAAAATLVAVGVRIWTIPHPPPSVALALAADPAEANVLPVTAIDAAAEWLRAHPDPRSAAQAQRLIAVAARYRAASELLPAQRADGEALALGGAETLVRADVLLDAARTALDLRRLPDAGRYAADALRIRTRLGHGGDAGAADCFLILGRAQMFLGRVEEAGQLFRRIQSMPLPPGKAGLVSRFDRIGALGELDIERGRPEAVYPLLRRNAEETAVRLGPSGLTAMALNNLAECETTLREYERASQHYDQAIRMQRAVAGNDGLAVALMLNNRAWQLHLQGDDAGAEGLYRESLRIRQKRLPTSHPDIAVSLNNLAVTLATMDRNDEAADAYRRALPITRASLGEGHPDVAMTMANLGKALMGAKRYAEAEPYLREAVARDRRNPVLSKDDMAVDVFNLAMLDRKLGKPAEAEALCREVLSLLAGAGFSRDQWRVADAYIVLGESLLDQGRNADALAVAREQRPFSLADKASYDDLNRLIAKASRPAAVVQSSP